MTNNLNRRDVLRGSLAGMAGLMTPSAVWSRNGSQSVFLVISDPSPLVPVRVLNNFIAPLVRNGIPFTISLDVKLWSAVEEERTFAVRQFLARLSNEYSGISEITPHIQGISTELPYFQARAINGAREGLVQLFHEFDQDNNMRDRIVTATDNQAGEKQWLRGLRSGGIRNMLLLPLDNGRTETATPDGRIVWYGGGVIADIHKERRDLQSLVEFSARGEGPTILRFSLTGLESLRESDARSVGNMLSEAILLHVNSGRIIPSVPADFHLQQRSDYHRLLTVVLESEKTDQASAEERSLAFRQKLQDAGIPTTFRALDAGISIEEHDRVIACANNRNFALEQVGKGCTPAQGQDMIADAHGWDTVNLAEDPAACGIDDDARLNVGRVVRINSMADLYKIGSGLSAVRDTVVVISADMPLQGISGQRLLTALIQTGAGSSSLFETLPGHVKAVTPADPVFEKFRRERNLTSAFQPVSDGGPDEEERLGLLEDAKTAFTFIERFRSQATGLLPTTASVPGSRAITYDRITMWDVGSLLLAIEAAYWIGLLEKAEYLNWTAQIIDGLPEVDIAGLKLPCSEMSTDDGSPLSRDFNACDVGRLLSAMQALRKEPILRSTIDAKMARWDVEGTITDGVFHNINGTRFDPFFISNCTHYAAQALQQFGMSIESPYDVLDPDLTEADWRMKLLYSASRVGLIGAEPLLFEPLELGWTREGKYLSEVLFTEQAHSFLQTGNLICVSEGPIHFRPWFTYQGLNIGSESERFGLEVISSQQRYQTDEFKQSVRSISVKSAFLWHAVHPHPYSSLLRNYVRDRARIEGLGFASSIFAETGEATPNYSDINTNAIILRAISHRLKAK